MGDRLPGAILSAAVDVGAIFQQVLNYGEPATGARLVQGAVAGVVSVVHVTHSVLQAVENHLLKKADTEGESGSVCVGHGNALSSCFLHPQDLHRGVSSDLCARTCFALLTLTSKNIYPRTCARTHTLTECVTVLHINPP